MTAVKSELIATDGIITIRPVEVTDADAIYEAAWLSQPQIYPWMSWCHPEYTRDESLAWIVMKEEDLRNNNEFAMAIIENANGRMLGTVGINMVNKLHHYANLGYWIRTDAARRGYATAATKLMTRIGFEKLGLNRVEIVMAVENTASERVAQKSGATREGVLREAQFLHGRYHDAAIYSIVRSDFE
ncbi:MAG: GNAT family N-acetyltransferase [bacterium]|nr:GNAT family N-acetyltransferase [Candidatus Kapabacteria bacterium]